MHSQILLFSSDDAITPGQLKEGLLPPQIDEVQTKKIQEWMEKNNVHGIVDGDHDFHYKLLLIKTKPYIMYYTGNLSLLDKPILGIVGPRKMSEYANKVLIHLFEKLACYDVVTISGMAQGVDQVCHNLSIQHKIPTIAVLGGGLGTYMQSPDRHMLANIVKNGGLVLSEYKLFQKPDYYTFPQRNRIIAGLCTTLCIPEASHKSGSLITADFAWQMRKPIYGTSNGIFVPSSQGINQWIADKKIHLIHDMDVYLGTFFKKKQENSLFAPTTKIFSDQEKKILTILSDKESSIQDISSQTGFAMSDIMSLLTLLEMDNYIYQETPGMYKIK